MENEMFDYVAWDTFKGRQWKKEINVSNFIDNNYSEYKGDDSFLVGKTEKTTKVWAKCEKLLAKERKVKLLDVDLKHISGINNFPAGYIDKKNEFCSINSNILKSNYSTFLVDKNNRVVLVGNPLSSDAMWSLFRKTLDNMLANDGLYVPQ